MTEQSSSNEQMPLSPPTLPPFVDLPLNNQSDSIGIFILGLELAQKRGVFRFDESAKIHDAIKLFITQYQQLKK